MTDKIQKYFRKLSEKQRHTIKEKLDQIEQHGISGVDVLPMKNRKGVYRLRVGRLIRILFRFDENGKIEIIDADNRDAIY